MLSMAEEERMKMDRETQLLARLRWNHLNSDRQTFDRSLRAGQGGPVAKTKSPAWLTKDKQTDKLLDKLGGQVWNTKGDSFTSTVKVLSAKLQKLKSGFIIMQGGIH